MSKNVFSASWSRSRKYISRGLKLWGPPKAFEPIWPSTLTEHLMECTVHAEMKMAKSNLSAGSGLPCKSSQLMEPRCLSLWHGNSQHLINESYGTSLCKYNTFKQTRENTQTHTYHPPVFGITKRPPKWPKTPVVLSSVLVGSDDRFWT